jgi:tetratricopeptide (TPR) repeat protein/transcriptional regulator with XRE-family HTH domain
VSFADQLSELRLRRRLTQEDLAEASGVSVRTISNLERAVTLPRRGTVRALAAGLDLNDRERVAFEQAARRVVPARRRGAANLPAPVTSIIGRADEIAAVSRMVTRGPARLVMITGPGGVGKSRLALEVGWRVADRFERVDTVDASALRSREEALVALATTVAAPARATADVASVAAVVGDTRRLLVVDGLEHVANVAQDLLGLLELCPNLRILATTRRREPGGVALPPLARDHAVRLLVDRVRAVRPEFTLTADNADAVAVLCERVDFLPLGIELAAGHLRTHDMADLAAGRDFPVTALAADVVDVPRRHRTLRDLVCWSTDQLSDVDRRRFVALGAFRGRVPPAAFRAVLRGVGDSTDGLGDTVARLSSVSLLTIGPDGLLLLLDTVREVAQELLDGSGIGTPCRVAHARYMLDLVRAAEPERIESHMDNVRAAVAFATEHHPALLDSGVVTSLADHLGNRGRFAEAYRMLAGIARAVPGAGRRVALLRAGIAANQIGDAPTAVRLATRARHEAKRAGDADGEIASLNLIGAAHKAIGNLDAAHRAYQECLEAATAMGNTRYLTVALNNLGTVDHERGHYEQALDRYRRSLEIKRGLGQPRAIATALVNLGGLQKDMGHHHEARDNLMEARQLFTELADPYGQAFALALLAEVQVRLGEIAASRSAEEAARAAAEIDHGHTLAMAELALGDLRAAQGDHEAAGSAYQSALSRGVEPFERARLLERLARQCADHDSAEAIRLVRAADEIRRAGQYAIPAIDRRMAEETRRKLGDSFPDRDDTAGSGALIRKPLVTRL